MVTISVIKIQGINLIKRNFAIQIPYYNTLYYI